MILCYNCDKKIKRAFLTGFTIIEIVVAITVLTVGVLGVSGFFTISAKLTRSANHVSTASNLAQGLIDEEIAKSYDELTTGTGVKDRVSSDSSDPFYNYFEQINISLLDSNLNTSENDLGLKKIDVIIFYQEGEAEKNVQLSTIKAKS